MNQIPILFTLGTPGGDWPGWVGELLRQAGGERLCRPAFAEWHDSLTGGDAPSGTLLKSPREAFAETGADDGDAQAWGGIDERACLTLDTLAQDFPQASFLVFVERPATGLAAALTNGACSDPDLWLINWRKAAQRILRHAQRHPARSLLVEAEEARRQPQQLARVWRDRFGAEVAPQESAIVAPAVGVDPLGSALAEALAAADRDAQELYSELRASCEPLSDDDADLDSDSSAARIDAAAAVLRLHELQAAPHAAQQAQQEADALRRDVESQAAQAAELRDQIEALVVVRDAQASQIADQARRIGDIEQARAAIESQLAEREAELNELREALDRSTGERDAALEESAARSAELDSRRQQAAAREQENELLLLQLHQVQEELETVFLARRAAEERLAEGTASAEQESARAATHAAELHAASTERDALAALALQRQQRVVTLEAEHGQHVRQIDELKADLTGLHEARQRMADEIDRAADDSRQRSADLEVALQNASSGRQESELLIQQLHHAQDELQAAVLARHAVEERLNGAAAAAERSDALVAELRHLLKAAGAESELQAGQAAQRQQQMVQLEHAHALQSAELGDARAHQSSLQDQVQRLTGEREQALAEARQHGTERDAAQQENELLLLQLHQVQEELESYFLECRKLEAKAAEAAEAAAASAAAAAARVPAASLPELSIGALVLAGERDSLPYRELTLLLTDLKVGTRAVAESTLRLVEHHGHPGLVIFGPVVGEPLLRCWRETGREDDRPYMLLVPTDRNCQTLFEAMASEDWLLLEAVVRRIEARLQEASHLAARYWRPLARRLREQLLELPQRLRFDAVEVEPAGDAASASMVLRFHRVHCGARQVERLTLRWRPHGPQAGIELLDDLENGPPLPSWPADDLAAETGSLLLPLGPEVPAEAKRERWTRLRDEDRGFLLALLEALPYALAQAPAGVLGADAGSRAAVLLADARRALEPAPPAVLARPVGLLRRAAGRLRRRETPATP